MKVDLSKIESVTLIDKNGHHVKDLELIGFMKYNNEPKLFIKIKNQKES